MCLAADTEEAHHPSLQIVNEGQVLKDNEPQFKIQPSSIAYSTKSLAVEQGKPPRNQTH